MALFLKPSPTRSLTHSLTYARTHALTHSLTRAPTQLGIIGSTAYVESNVAFVYFGLGLDFIYFDHLSRIYQLFITLHALCDVICLVCYVVPMR